MYRTLINVVPFWLLMIGMMLFPMSLAWLSAHLSRRFFPGGVDSEHRSMTNSLIGILGGGFSILLAFVIINSWNYILSARDAQSREIDAISVILRDIGVFPPKIRDTIITDLKNYADAVRTDEWKTMRNGQESEKAWERLAVLFHTLQAYQPQSSQQALYYLQTLNNLNTLLQARRDRLNKLQSVFPRALMDSLLLGSIGLVIMLGAMRGESRFVAISPVLMFAAILGFNLGLAISFDYPYSGDISIPDHQFHRAIFNKAHPAASMGQYYLSIEKKM